MKAIVILSGGMDSTTLLYDVINQGYDTKALSFNYGQKHKLELDKARQTTSKLNIPHKIVSLDSLSELAPSALTRSDWNVPEGHFAAPIMKETIVPNRNMVLLALAGAYAIGEKANVLFYGAHAGDHDIYPDCRPEFVKAIQEALGLADWHKLRLEAPYLNINKGDIVKKGLDLNVDYGLTWTCYKGVEPACGKCGSCTERLDAFASNNIEDVIKYEKK